MRIVFIVPAFNESDSICGTIKGLQSIHERLAAEGHEARIVVIDDGSWDDTARKARDAGADEVIVHSRNRGLGASVRTGLETAHLMDAEICVKLDADLQHDPEDIPHLIAPILRGQADIVYGERFAKIEYRMPLVRRWGNQIFTSFMRRLTGWPVKDSQPGIFAVHASYLNIFDIPGDYNYTQQIMLDAYLKGMRFAQVPVSFRQRRTGQSFITLRYPFETIMQIILVICISKPMAICFPVGLALIASASTVFSFQIIEWAAGFSSRPVQNVMLALGMAVFGIQMLLFGILAKLIMLSWRRGPRTSRPGSAAIGSSVRRPV